MRNPSGLEKKERGREKGTAPQHHRSLPREGQAEASLNLLPDKLALANGTTLWAGVKKGQGETCRRVRRKRKSTKEEDVGPQTRASEFSSILRMRYAEDGKPA